MANPFTIVSTGTRHLLDANVTFGMSSDRYNARDKYRRSYSDDQRLGAGIGTGLGVALPIAAGVAWAQRGMKVPGLTSHADKVANGLAQAGIKGMSAAAMQNVGRGVGIAALGLAAGVGVKKSIEIAKDDGDLRAPGGAAGVIGGTIAGVAIGGRFGGKIGAMSGGLGAIAGGAIGHFVGKQVSIGERQVGKEFVQAANDDAHEIPFTDVEIDGAPGRAISFGAGAINHFNEVGPATQGISFGYQWGMRDAVQNKYSNVERAGGMHGDLAAAGVLGGGALAVAMGMMGRSAHASQGMSGLQAGADIAGNVLARGPIPAAMQKLGTAGTVGIGAAAVGIAGVAGWKAFQSDKENFGAGAAALIGAGTLAATAGTAAAVSRSGAMSAMAPGAKAANSMLVAAALIGVLSAARLPLQQFMNDAKDAHKANGKVDVPVAATAAGVGAVGGGLGAFKGLSKLVPDSGLQLGKFHVPKGAVVAAGTAIGAAAAGGIGFGLSATMPDIKTVGMSAGGAALAGAGLGAFALRGMPNFPGVGGALGRAATGAVAGAALGLSASSLLRSDEPAAAEPTTPQEVAGSASE